MQKQANMNTHIDLPCIAYKNPWMLFVCLNSNKLQSKTSKTNKFLITSELALVYNHS